VQDSYKILRRIAATLLALAVFAERAADRSRPIRWLVLWVLQRAEAAASGLFAETDSVVSIGYPVPLDGHDEAIRLAKTFRMLAAVMLAVAHQAQCLAIKARAIRPSGGCLSGYLANTCLLFQAITVIEQRYADTS